LTRSPRIARVVDVGPEQPGAQKATLSEVAGMEALEGARLLLRAPPGERRAASSCIVRMGEGMSRGCE